MILTKIFKNNRVGGIIFIVLLLTAQWISSFSSPPASRNWEVMPLYALIFEPLHSLPLLSSFIAMLITGIMAMLLIRLNVKYFLIEDRSFMPATFFILVTGTIAPLQQVSPLLIGSLFLLLTLIIFLNAQVDKPDSLRIFNASLLLALGSLFCLQLIWFIPFLWFTMLLLRPLRWREMAYPVVAFLLLALFLVTYYWVIPDDLPALGEVLRNNFRRPESYFHFDRNQGLFILYLLFLILLASIYLINRFQTRKIVIRKLYQVFFLLFLYSALFGLIIFRLRPEMLFLIAIPVSYLLSNFFHRRKSHWSHELLLWILIGVIVWVKAME